MQTPRASLLSPTLLQKRLPSIGLSLLVAVALALTLGCSSSSSSSTKPSSDSKGSSGATNTNSNKSQSQNTIAVLPSEQATAGIRLATIQPRSVPRTLSVPGQIAMDDQRTAHIGPYFDGTVTDVAHNAGDLVHPGEVLAHVHSHSLHETVGALAQNFANAARAQSAVLYAQQKHDRYAHLYSIQAASLEQQQSSQQELLQAQTELANAQAAVVMEREHLADLLQVPPASVTPATLYTYENLPIKSPIAGTIITRAITPGMVLQPGMEAYTISNLSSVWLIASVNEADLSHLRLGQHVTVRSTAWPNETFPGAVTLIGSTLDPATRTIQLRATIPNPRNQLKPQMFTTADIEETGAAPRQALYVPEDALQEINGIQSVFVTADGTHFSPRALKTLPAVSGQVEITDGLHPGDRIAIAGAFTLKSDLLKGTIGDE